MSKRFLFFENFKSIGDKLPDDMRLKFYDALLNYVFEDKEPDDVMIAALITAIKPSLDKEDNRGGAREGAGRPKQNEDLNNQKNQKYSKEIKNIQNKDLNNQKNQSFLETEEGRKKQEDLNTQSSDKSSDCVVRKKLVSVDWYPKPETVEKLKAKGLDADKTVEKFINSCRAKNLKYIDFDRAILAWDWSKDDSVKQEDDCWL